MHGSPWWARTRCGSRAASSSRGRTSPASARRPSPPGSPCRSRSPGSSRTSILRSPSMPCRRSRRPRRSGTSWSGRCTYEGEWAEPVRTSLRVLKGLIYHPTGGIVAAPTTSLPEWIGGPRNWDYRYCWLRDATLTLVALLDSGYLDEARGWREWLFRAAAGRPADLQIMYGVAGERRLAEYEADWLPGYEGLDTGPDRQRRLGADAAGRVRRDHRRLHDGTDARPRALGSRLAAHRQPARVPGRGLAPPGRGHLGGARAEPALHALEGDGLGGVRPGDPDVRAVGPRGADGQLAVDPGRHPRRRLCQRLRPRARLVRPVVRCRGGSTRASC